MAAARAGRRQGALKTPLREVCKQYLTCCEGGMERRERMTRHNLAVYEGSIRNYICPDPARRATAGNNRSKVAFAEGIGELTFGDLTAETIGDFRDRRRSSGVMPIWRGAS